MLPAPCGGGLGSQPSFPPGRGKEGCPAAAWAMGQLPRGSSCQQHGLQDLRAKGQGGLGRSPPPSPDQPAASKPLCQETGLQPSPAGHGAASWEGQEGDDGPSLVFLCPSGSAGSGWRWGTSLTWHPGAEPGRAPLSWRSGASARNKAAGRHAKGLAGGGSLSLGDRPWLAGVQAAASHGLGPPGSSALPQPGTKPSGTCARG